MFLAIALLSFTSLFGQYEITKQCFHAPEKLGSVNLFYSDTDKSFSVLNNGQMKPVQRAFMDKELRSMDVRTLHKFLGNGYLSLQKMDNQEFSLKANVRGLGGGWLTGLAAAWTVRAICYGGASAAIATGVGVTGGAAIGAIGGAMGASPAAIATTIAVAKVGVTKTIAGSLTGAAIGATGPAMVTTAIVATGGTAVVEATAATAMVVGTTGGVTGAIAAVEGFALAAQVAGTAVWWLP